MKKCFLLIALFVPLFSSVCYAEGEEGHRNRFEYICSLFYDADVVELSIDYSLDTETVTVLKDSVVAAIRIGESNETLAALAYACYDMRSRGIEPPEKFSNPTVTFAICEFKLNSPACRNIRQLTFDLHGNEIKSIDRRNDPYVNSSDGEILSRVHEYVKEYVKRNSVIENE